MRLTGKFLKPLLLSLVAGSLLFTGCGDSGRNDQGTSFTFLGWFQVPAGQEPTIANLIGATTAITPLANSEAANSPSVFLFAGLQNNLTGQTIRGEFIEHDYFVPGGEIDVPSETVRLAIFLGAQPAAGAGGQQGGAAGGQQGAQQNNLGAFDQSSLPTSLDGTGDGTGTQPITPTNFAGVELVTAGIRSFLVFNRARFPEVPYRMIVTSRATGITSAGDTVVSNDVSFDVTWTEDVLIEAPDTTAASTTDTAGLAELEEGLTFEDEE